MEITEYETWTGQKNYNIVLPITEGLSLEEITLCFKNQFPNTNAVIFSGSRKPKSHLVELNLSIICPGLQLGKSKAYSKVNNGLVKAKKGLKKLRKYRP